MAGLVAVRVQVGGSSSAVAVQVGLGERLVAVPVAVAVSVAPCAMAARVGNSAGVASWLSERQPARKIRTVTIQR